MVVMSKRYRHWMLLGDSMRTLAYLIQPHTPAHTYLRAKPPSKGPRWFPRPGDPADGQPLCEVSTLAPDQIIGFPFVSRIHVYPLTRHIQAGVRRGWGHEGPLLILLAIMWFTKQADIIARRFFFFFLIVIAHWQKIVFLVTLEVWFVLLTWEVPQIMAIFSQGQSFCSFIDSKCWFLHQEFRKISTLV